MKTTVDIPDDLFRKAKRVAAAEHTTLRALLEEGLRIVLRGRDERPGFRLRDASIGGDGPAPGIVEGDWERIREAIYDGRGS